MQSPQTIELGSEKYEISAVILLQIYHGFHLISIHESIAAAKVQLGRWARQCTLAKLDLIRPSSE